MERIFILIFTLIIGAGTTLQSKSINNMFVQRSVGDESLFYIFPQTLPAYKDTKSESKSLDYDYTYVQKNDSVTMLISLTLKAPVKKIKAEITCNNAVYRFEPELLFAKPKGNKLVYRLRLSMPYKDFENINMSPTPFVLSFYYGINEKESILNFGYNQKKWNENRQKMTSILNLININTGKNE